MSEKARLKREDREAEDAAIEALSAELRPSLLRWFSRKVSDCAEAEDLVQEVFLRLVKLNGFDGNLPSARAYVFHTANSVLFDWLRKRRVRHTDAHDELENDHPADADFPPERVLIGRERFAEATAALLELPERTRVIFVLRRVEGLKCKDIARRLNISVSAVEKHMARAMAHLMKRVDDQ